MVGEAGILSDDDSMLAVGHIFINRLLDPSHQFGYYAADVANEFHGYDPDRVISPEHMELAKQLVADRMVLGTWSDPTQGCFYILSHQDIANIFGVMDAVCVRQSADWQSTWRKIDGIFYRLYGFKKWPKPSNGAPLCDPRENHG